MHELRNILPHIDLVLSDLRHPDATDGLGKLLRRDDIRGLTTTFPFAGNPSCCALNQDPSSSSPPAKSIASDVFYHKICNGNTRRCLLQSRVARTSTSVSAIHGVKF
jgi:hypothetical protein